MTYYKTNEIWNIVAMAAIAEPNTSPLALLEDLTVASHPSRLGFASSSVTELQRA